MSPSATFCNQCGASVASQGASTASSSQYTNVSAPISSPDMPMKWHNALTIWLMIVWGIANIARSISYFTGNIFLEGVPSEYADEVLEMLYKMAPSLETIAMLAGVFSVVYGIMCFVTFPRLKRFEASGLKLFNGLMIASIVANIALAIALMSAVSDIQGLNSSDAVNWPTLIVSIAFSFANLVYYKKREHLFR